MYKRIHIFFFTTSRWIEILLLMYFSCLLHVVSTMSTCNKKAMNKSLIHTVGAVEALVKVVN